MITKSHAQQPNTQLNDFRWEHRLIVIQAKSGADENITRQNALFESCGAGLRERRLLIFIYAPPKQKTQQDRLGNALTLPTSWVQEFQASSTAFEMRLVGLDGGVKAIWTQHTTCQDIFDRIDAMPMRQQELQKQ